MVCVSENKARIVRRPSASVLGEVRGDDILLGIWERAPIAALKPAVEGLLEAEEPIRLDLRYPCGGNLRREILGHLPSRGLVESASALAADCLALAGEFAAISGSEELRLRLERVEDDGCALFHVDTLRLRMLCTYAGPGTQWLEEDNVRRDQLGSRGRSLEEANAAIVIDPGKIRTARAWHVRIFKGRLWEGHGYHDGLVHRSAPVRHPRDHRLRLSIDLSDAW